MNAPLPAGLVEQLSDLLAAAIVTDVRARLAREHALEDAPAEAIANAKVREVGR